MLVDLRSGVKVNGVTEKTDCVNVTGIADINRITIIEILPSDRMSPDRWPSQAESSELVEISHHLFSSHTSKNNMKP